jgi:hypothetical protein
LACRYLSYYIKLGFFKARLFLTTDTVHSLQLYSGVRLQIFKFTLTNFPRNYNIAEDYMTLLNDDKPTVACTLH